MDISYIFKTTLIIGIIFLGLLIFIRVWLRIFGIREQGERVNKGSLNAEDIYGGRQNGCCIGKGQILDLEETRSISNLNILPERPGTNDSVSQRSHQYLSRPSNSWRNSWLSLSRNASIRSDASDIFDNPSPKSPNLFLFPHTHKTGLSSGESNLLPSSRHSFRYDVHLPGEKEVRSKRRSLPEILLHFTRRSSASSTVTKALEVRRPSEFLIHIEDFDELDHFGSLDVGLKGSLGLPVCDESPTKAEIVEVKPIARSGSNQSFNKLTFLYGSKRKQETLI